VNLLFAAFAILLTQGLQDVGNVSRGNASVEGYVVNSVTGGPIEGVRVTLTKDLPAESNAAIAAGNLSATDSVKASASGSIGGITINVTPSAPPAAPPTLSDDKGKFVFRDLDPGLYRITFAKNGYVRHEYGQRSLSGQGMPFRLAAGQAMKDIAIRLTPTGTIVGRVFNEVGRPLANAPVELIRNTYNAAGQKIVQTVNSTVTNDRGEYRFFFVTPGRYFLGAGTTSSVSGELLVSLKWTSPNELAEASGHLFYPGVVDIGAATTIDVSMGVELGGLDFHLGPQKKFRLRGRVVDGEGKPPANASLGLAFSVPGAAGGINFGGDYKSADGTFEFKDLVPGSYSIVERGGAVVNGRVVSERPGMAVQVSVVNADVEGLVLTVPPVAAISGQLTVDGRSFSNIPELEKLRVRLVPPADDLSYYARNNFVVPTPASLDKDGGFKLDNTPPGEFRVAVLGLPAGYFIKEASFGGADVLNQVLRFDSSQTARLEIVISPNSAQLSGVVMNDKQQPASGVQVVLIPDRGRGRVELYKTSVTDDAGRFMMMGVPEGDFRLFAWEAIEPNSWFDPDVVRNDEPKAHAVHINPLSNETVEVRAIPVAP
jgi:5-hydroxyisourate hydrolase-like protein (transthyretin family)